MFSNARIALKFFTYGLLIGVFFAPRSGAESRKKFLKWINEAVLAKAGM